jgi:hypothetical protein
MDKRIPFQIQFYYLLLNNIIMKKTLFLAFLMITSFAVFSQEQPKPVMQNQFADYVQFRKEHHQRPEFGPEHFPMHPRPEKVIVKGDKVILIFNREDFKKLRPLVNEKIMWKERPHNRFNQLMIEHLTK